MSNNIYIPYTYLIGWSRLNWWYYGSEYANSKNKIANPSNLWTTYFTSSKEVGRIRTVYGEPDVIQIRKTFENEQSCRKWEQKVLTKLKVIGNSKWLNKTNNICYEPMFGETNPSWKGGSKTLFCLICNKEYNVGPNRQSKYCSQTCVGIGQRNRIIINCEICKIAFEKPKSASKNKKYCSTQCHGVAMTFKQMGENNPNYKKEIKLICGYCNQDFYIKPFKRNRKFCCKSCQLSCSREHGKMFLCKTD